MVFPVPPTPHAGTGEAIAHGSSETGNGLTDDDASLRRRFGPGFELRDNGQPPAPVAPPVPPNNGHNEAGAALYRNILSDEFRRRNLPDPSRYFAQDSSYHRVSEALPSDLVQAGQQLRVLSAEFAQSPMRQWVGVQAASVPLHQLDCNAFSDILYGLFQEGGVTWERVIVLFYFCADLAARAFREELPRQFQNIVEWALRFFTGERMIQWVAENGGWANVMQNSVSQAYRIAKIGVFFIGAFTILSYLWKWKPR